MNDKPLTIAMLSVHSSPIGRLGTKDTGGMSIYVRVLARELGSRNHCVDIFTHQNGLHKPTVMELYPNVRLVHLANGATSPQEKHEFVAALPHYFRDLSMFKDRYERHYDVIHSHYWISGPLGLWAQERWKVPNVITFHTLGEVKSDLGCPEPADRIQTERKLVNNCGRIISATDREKAQLLNHYGASPDKIGIVPCGVDFDRFLPMGRDVSRKKLRLGDQDSVLLYVGRFDQLKGLERLLEAMTLVRHRRNVKLVVVGGDGLDDPVAQRFHCLCREWKLEDKVRFYGAVNHEELPAYYCAADCLVIPSLYESFSLVALESLACGTPVLATRVGAMEDLLREGINGSIIESADRHSLASGIETFVAQKSLYRNAQEAIRESAKKFTWGNAATALLKEYALVRKT